MIRSTVYVQGDNKAIRDSVMEKYQVNMKVPADYVIGLEADSIIWLRQEIPKFSRSILVSRFPYHRESQFISTTTDGTYMRVNAVDLPVFTKTTEIDGNFAFRAAGIWEIVGDFMGGAFVSYAVLDASRQEVVLLDGFVYAPEEDKKLSMIYLDHILRQTKLEESL